MTTPSTPSPLQAFARAAALLADPFNDRARALASLGLDEGSWARLQGQWFTEMRQRSAEGDDRLASAFALAFAEERESLLRERKPKEAPAAPLVQAVGDTTMPPRVVHRPAVPFVGKRPAPPLCDSAQIRQLGIDTTVEIETAPATEVMPFARRGAP
jgi:hypothetical protein